MPSKAQKNYANGPWATAAKPVPVKLPSGQWVDMKPPNLEALVAAGVLDKMDSLTSIVDKKHIKPKKSGGRVTQELDAGSLMQDTDNLLKVIEVADKVTVFMVLTPKVKLAPADDSEREENQVYTDMIGLEDKMFIFQYASGGGTDLESFRGKLQSNMDNVANGAGIPLSS